MLVWADSFRESGQLPWSSTKKGKGNRLSFFVFVALYLFEDGRAESGVSTEGAAALQSLLELVGLTEILQRVRIINAIVEPALA